MISIASMVQEAIANGKLKALLLGEEGYKISMPHFVPIDLPNNYFSVLREGLWKVSEGNKNSEINLKIEDAILSLLDSEIGLYCFILLLDEMRLFEASTGNVLNLDYEKITKHFENRFNSLRENLKLIKMWSSTDHKDGMYGEIKRLVKLDNKNYPNTKIAKIKL